MVSFLYNTVESDDARMCGGNLVQGNLTDVYLPPA
jgi:hypothetical protein